MIKRKVIVKNIECASLRMVELKSFIIDFLASTNTSTTRCKQLERVIFYKFSTYFLCWRLLCG